MKNTLILVAVLLGIVNVYGQKSIQELAELSDKKFEKKVSSGNSAVLVKSFAKNARRKGVDLPDPLVPPLKKVGILSFFTADLSERDSKAIRRGGIYESFLTTDGGKEILQSFHDEALNALKNEFSSQGIMLLTPEEYLTEETLEIYDNFQIETSKMGSAVLASANYLQGQSEKSIVAATGYKVFPAPTVLSGTDPKVISSMADLANQLGVDALLTVQIVTRKEKNKIGLSAIRISLHGPNPVPDDPKVKYGLGKYVSGILIEYAGTEFNPAIPFAYLNKKDKSFESIETQSFDTIIKRYASILLANFKSDYVEK